MNSGEAVKIFDGDRVVSYGWKVGPWVAPFESLQGLKIAMGGKKFGGWATVPVENYDRVEPILTEEDYSI